MNLKNRLLFVVVFFQLIFSAAPSMGLEVPAQWKFKTISTPHFDVIYNAEQQELGEFYAHQIEKAYALTSTVFTALPAKTLIIVNDKTDATNGYATRIPYPHIMTYPVLPGPQESLGESGDWALELLAHEYTHILTFEPANGIFHVLRGVFGTISAPNILLPAWWKEGLAVQMESMITPHGGRAKSLYQDALIRAMVEDGKFLDYGVDQANEYIPTWPEGSRPYLFGSIFWSQSVDDYGKNVMNDLNQRHSSRVPYFINAPAEDLLKDSYEEAYTKAMFETRYLAQRQIKELKETPLTPTLTLPIQAKYSTAPAISDDGKYLALLTVDYKADRVIDIYERDPESRVIMKKLKVEIKKDEEPVVPKNNAHEDGPPSGSIQRISWFHKSPKLVYDRLHYVSRIERYSDLSTYDVATGKTKEITRALRAREPSVSPNDEQIVFVKLEGGKTHLGLLDVATEKARIVYSPPLQTRLSQPVFLDESRIVFAERSPIGEEGLKIYSLKDGSITALFPGYQQARFPQMTVRGLMFTAANNGVHNLYLASEDLKTARPISHTLSMISTAAMDPDTQQIYATTMTSSGPLVKRIEKSSWEKTPATLPPIEKLFADRYENLIEAPAETPTTYPVSDYSPGQYLWPRYWFPFLWSSPEGGLEIQVMTSGFDPLQKHAYSAMGGWNTYLNAADWSFNYLNNVTNLPVQLSASQSHSYIVNRENLVDDTLVSLSALPDVWSFSEKVGVEVGWRYIQRSIVSTPATKRTGPYGTFIYKNITQGGEQFSPQEGKGAYLSAANYIDGQDLFPHSQFQAGGIYYFSQFLPKLHSIMARASVLYTPEKISYIYGTQTAAADYIGNDFGAKFLARGYSTGQFVGRNMYAGSLEYRFPISDVYKGAGTFPAFFRRVWGAFVTDAVATDGRVFDIVNETSAAVDAHQVFWGYGAEAHFETTLGYELPVTFMFGIYQGADKKYAPNPTSALAIQFAGF